MLQREAAGAGNPFDAEQKCDVGVSKCDAFEIVVVRAHEVEEGLAAIAVEDHFTVTRRFDDDRFVRGSALRQVVCAIEQIAHCEITGSRLPVHIVETVSDIKSGVHKNRVSRLHARRKGILVIEMREPHVIRRHQPRERRLLLRPLPVHRIHVIQMPALRGLRFFSRANGNDLLGCSRDAIRIAEIEAAFVFSIRLKVQNASGEHVRRGVFEERKARLGSRGPWSRRDANLLTLRAHERQRLAPLLLTFLAIRHIDARVAIVVARDFPFESKGNEGRRLDYKLTGGCRSWGLRD